MLEFSDKGTSWLVKKRNRDVSEEASKNMKILATDELIKPYNFITSSFDHKRRRLREDSTHRNDEQRMSLDLKLNLSPSLVDLNHHYDYDHDHDRSNCNEDERKKKQGSMLGLKTQKNMAWVAFDLDDNGRNGGGSQEEMVARVCMKCHMLVMLCKATPACPNCKFMHSTEDTSLSLLFTPKPTLLA